MTAREWALVWGGPWSRAGIALAVLATIAALAISAWTYRRLRRPWPRALLIALRALALGGALLLFLQPALDLRKVRLGRNHVAVLVDDSRSMELSDQPGGPTRRERAREALRRAAPLLDTWRRSRQVDFYTFSDALRPAGDEPLAGAPGCLTPRGGTCGDATRIGEALESVARRYDGRDLGGIVLVSDGVDNGRFGRALDAAGRAQVERLGAPVHAAWVGRPGLRDVAVSAMASGDFAFVRTVFRVEAIVRAADMGGRKAEVVLRREGQVLQTRVIELRAGEPLMVSFDIVPERVGEAYYEVTIPVQPDEAIGENNARGFVLRTLRDKLRVLHVCGRPSWDVLFLRRLLERNPNVDLISFFILRTPTDLQLAPQSELSLIPFPTRELFEQEIKSFDLVLLQDFNFAPYGIAPYLARMRGFVDAGGGLAMIGGALAFTQGDWGGTPVGDALPVDLLPKTADPSRMFSTGEFRPRTAAGANDHPLLRIGATREESAKLWRTLPPLEGANLVGGARGGATVLAVHPTLRAPDGAPMPVLAVRSVGAGRTLALASGSSWRWAFTAAAGGGDARAYDRFWEGALRWLAQDPELRQVRVDVARPTWAAGEDVPVVARALSRDYRPAPGVAVTLAWRRLGAAETEGVAPVVRETGESGEAVIALRPDRPGAWRVTASATIDGRVHTDEETFLVESPLRELEDPEARAALLREIAQASGGRFVEGSASWAGFAARPPRVAAIESRRQVELWDGPWAFLGIVGVLALEWALRRRLGFA